MESKIRKHEVKMPPSMMSNALLNVANLGAIIDGSISLYASWFTGEVLCVGSDFCCAFGTPFWGSLINPFFEDGANCCLQLVTLLSDGFSNHSWNGSKISCWQRASGIQRQEKSCFSGHAAATVTLLQYRPRPPNFNVVARFRNLDWIHIETIRSQHWNTVGYGEVSLRGIKAMHTTKPRSDFHLEYP